MKIKELESKKHLAKTTKRTIPKTKPELVQVVVEGMQEKKGKEICVIDLSGIEGVICDHFVICHGDSTTHVDAIADSVVQTVRKKLEIRSSNVEGLQNLQWVLVDLGSVVVHIFQKKYREFYKLEDLWSDGKITQYEDLY